MTKSLDSTVLCQSNRDRNRFSLSFVFNGHSLSLFFCLETMMSRCHVITETLFFPLDERKHEIPRKERKKSPEVDSVRRLFSREEEDFCFFETWNNLRMAILDLAAKLTYNSSSRKYCIVLKCRFEK